jgi:hypothetical protein
MAQNWAISENFFFQKAHFRSHRTKRAAFPTLEALIEKCEKFSTSFCPFFVAKIKSWTTKDRGK